MSHSRSTELAHPSDNPESIARNQLNTSKSKMQFSFGQSDRFSNSVPKSASPPKFYDLPSLWGERGVSIGRSQRTNFGKQNVPTPSPNNYALQDSFTKKKSQGITMRLGRQDVKCGNLFTSLNTSSPSANAYHPELAYNSRSFSIGHKLAQENKWVRQVPGPGNYPYMELTTNKSRKLVSKYISAPCAEFGRQKRANLALNSIAPGPGAYLLRSEIADESLFEKPYATRFGSSSRPSIDNQKLETPGPGTYKAFSQFSK